MMKILDFETKDYNSYSKLLQLDCTGRSPLSSLFLRAVTCESHANENATKTGIDLNF